MNLSLRKIGIYIAVGLGVLLIVTVVFYFLLSHQTKPPAASSPETAATIDDMYSFLDEQTKEAFSNNLTSYTKKQRDNFRVMDGSYKKTADGSRFRIEDKQSFARYDIVIEPNSTHEYNYVNISCAPDEDQLSWVTCNINTQSEDGPTRET